MIKKILTLTLILVTASFAMASGNSEKEEPKPVSISQEGLDKNLPKVEKQPQKFLPVKGYAKDFNNTGKIVSIEGFVFLTGSEPNTEVAIKDSNEKSYIIKNGKEIPFDSSKFKLPKDKKTDFENLKINFSDYQGYKIRIDGVISEDAKLLTVKSWEIIK